MEQIACKECTSPYCNGCNMYRLERMLMSGKLDALMNENRTIKMDADVRPVVLRKWKLGVCQTCFFDWSEVAPLASVPNFCPNCGADMREEESRHERKADA